MITVGQPSAARLLAEGAYCLDTDTDAVSRHGEVSVLPAPGESSSPILVGITRGWRSTRRGVVAGLLVLAVVVAVLGPALTVVPLGALRLVVGGCCWCSDWAGCARRSGARRGSRPCTTRARSSPGNATVPSRRRGPAAG